MYIYNPHITNIDAISGALFTLRIQYEYTPTQCDEGARDVQLVACTLGRFSMSREI